MTAKTKRMLAQRGAAHLVVVLACIIIVVIFAAGWTVARSRQAKDDSPARSLPTANGEKKAVSDVGKGQWMVKGGPGSTWSYEGGTPPDCPEPILALSPADTAKATEILLPGQYRGTHYKAHGGIRYDGSRSTDVLVKLPIDATLVGLKRYMESGELQYLLEFEHPCGIRIRFDHLAVLTNSFAKIADTTPAPTEDTRSAPTPELFGQKFKAGTTVATAIGHPKANNIGFDFGVYDLRKPNAISKNAQWAALHRDESAYTYHGVCWLPMLPKKQADKLNSLIGSNYSNKYISDYCDNAPGGSTLQYNNGRP